jgi:hypothetical protein
MEKWCVRVVEIKRNLRHDREKNGDPAYLGMKAKTWNPLAWLSILGCLFAIAILALTFVLNDGMGLLAVLLLALLSTVIGIGNKWTLKSAGRPNTRNADIPPGDVVIRFPQGSFLIVKCDEEVARELYFAPEIIEYLIEQPAVYRLISLIGTSMLMFGVIALGNSKRWTQVAFAISFMALNAAYWIVAALPNRLHWDTSCFEVTQQRLSTSCHKHYIDKSESYTEALFKTICVTRNIDWIRKGAAAPDTPAWDRWLSESRRAVVNLPVDESKGRMGVKTWPVPDAQTFNAQHVMHQLVAEHHVFSTKCTDESG